MGAQSKRGRAELATADSCGNVRLPLHHPLCLEASFAAGLRGLGRPLGRSLLLRALLLPPRAPRAPPAARAAAVAPDFFPAPRQYPFHRRHSFDLMLLLITVLASSVVGCGRLPVGCDPVINQKAGKPLIRCAFKLSTKKRSREGGPTVRQYLQVSGGSGPRLSGDYRRRRQTSR